MTGEILSLETAISLEKSKQIENLKKENKKQKEVLDKIKEKINEKLKEGRPIEEGKPEEYLWLIGYYDACKDLNELLEDNNEEN